MLYYELHQPPGMKSPRKMKSVWHHLQLLLRLRYKLNEFIDSGFVRTGATSGRRSSGCVGPLNMYLKPAAG